MMRALVAWRVAVVAAPAFLAASHVLTVYADTGSVLESVPRPLFLAILAAIAVEMIALLLIRRPGFASLYTTTLVALVIFPPQILIAAPIGLLLGIIVLRRRLDARPLAVVPAVLLVIAMARVAGSETFAPEDLFPGNDGPSDAASDAPSVYLFLLDGYPRSDTLGGFGFDNEAFESALDDRGFDVASHSRGSYPFTAQVMASMLNMAHLPDLIVDSPQTREGHARAIRDAIRDSAALAELERRGYHTVSVGLPSTVITLRGVDEYIDFGQVTLFEHQVMNRTLIWPVIKNGWLLDMLRSQVIQTFDASARVAAAARDEPVFMLTHSFAPHPPFVFDAEGERPDLCASWRCDSWTIYQEDMGLDLAKYERAYVEQVQYINRLTLDALDAVIASDPEAVVIVFSDHGARADPSQDDEWYRTFFAARTPGQPGLFGDDARAIEIFPTLFGTYLDEQVATPEPATFESLDGLRYPLDVTSRQAAR